MTATNERLASWTEDELGVAGRVLDVVRAPAAVLSVDGMGEIAEVQQRIFAALDDIPQS